MGPAHDPRFTNHVPCRHRTITMVVTPPSQQPPTFPVPAEPGPIDDLLEYLCAADRTPEVDEITVNAMKLMFSSSRAKALIDTTQEQVIEYMAEPTGLEGPIPGSKLLHALELLMAMGFLTGTAVGFAAGLEFVSDDDGEGDGDMDEGGYTGL